MSASKKSGSSTKCCPCDNCYETDSKGTRISGKRKTAQKRNTKGSPGVKNNDCCNFDFGPPTPGLHPDTPPGPPCFEGQKDENGSRLKDKGKVKNDLKKALKKQCPNMSDDKADEMADKLADDLEKKIQQEAENVPDKNYEGMNTNSGPCNFKTCLENYNVDPASGTAEGDGFNDKANTSHDCNPIPPCEQFLCPPNFENPGPIQNPPL